MPLEAGEYAVFLSTTDATLAPTPADGHEVRLLTVAAGNAGAAPEPTLHFDRMDTDYLTGDTLASSGPATLRVDNTVGGAFQLALQELRPDATRHDFELWQQAAPDPATLATGARRRSRASGWSTPAPRSRRSPSTSAAATS